LIPEEFRQNLSAVNSNVQASGSISFAAGEAGERLGINISRQFLPGFGDFLPLRRHE